MLGRSDARVGLVDHVGAGQIKTKAKVIRKPRLLSDNASSYISGDPVEWLEEHLSSRTRFIPAASPRVWPLTCGVSSCRVFGVSCGAQALGFGSPVLAFPLLHDPLPGPCRGSHRPPSRQPPKFQNRAFAALKGACHIAGKLNVAAGFQAWHRPVTMLDRISGKKVVHKLRIDPGQTRPRRSGML